MQQQRYKCCVRVNEHLTEDFCNNIGVKQGDHNSPLFFNLYLNDLLESINHLSNGIKLGGLNISILAYADDIVLISDSKSKLQHQINTLRSWCSENCIEVNIANLNSNNVFFLRT